VDGPGLLNNPVLPGVVVDGLAAAQQALAGAKRRPEAIEQAAKDFESVLLHKLFDEVKRTIPESGLLGDGTSSQVHDIFWMYLAQALAERGGLGLWRQLKASFEALAAPADQPARVEQSA